MAASFVVQGATVVTLDSNGTGGLTNLPLGYTTNENPWEVDITTHLQPVFSTETGDVPADHIYRGRDAQISGTLVKWDVAMLATLLGAPQGDGSVSEVEGDNGQVGVLLSSEVGDLSPREFTLTIAPAILHRGASPRYTYTFGRVILAPGGSLSLKGMESTAMTMPIQFFAMPTSDGLLYARTEVSS